MIEIVEYRAEWLAEFQRIASPIREVLGDRALRIDHIGSTAVVGLAAKDRIDVQITVAALTDEVKDKLGSLGYTHATQITADHRPPGNSSPDEHWQKWFFRAPSQQRPTNTHVRIAGMPNQRYALMFRDYLRVHSATAAAYAELKRRLVRELRNIETYPDVKDPAVDLIYLAAEAWATQSGWQVGASDA